MKKKNLKKLIILNIPYVVIGLVATNVGEAFRIAGGTNASAVNPGFTNTSVRTARRSSSALAMPVSANMSFPFATAIPSAALSVSAAIQAVCPKRSTPPKSINCRKRRPSNSIKPIFRQKFRRHHGFRRCFCRFGICFLLPIAKKHRRIRPVTHRLPRRLSPFYTAILHRM